MRRVSTVAGRSRARDERGRFVSQSIPRARSRPIEDRSEEESESQIRGLQEEARADRVEDGSDVEAADPQHQKVKESENYRIAIEDEETVRWGDTEDEAEEPLGWDFLDLRRRSSVLSGALQAVRDRRVSVLPPGQPGGRVAMAAQIKFIQPPLFARKEEEDVTELMERYEKMGNYNRWGEAEKRAHVELLLTGRLRNGSATKGKPDNSLRIGERRRVHQSLSG
jgi:hypothetical protein